MKALFSFYRIFISPAIQTAFGIQCRYEESCSRYAERMIRENGFAKGFWLGLKRLLSCNSIVPALSKWRVHGK